MCVICCVMPNIVSFTIQYDPVWYRKLIFKQFYQNLFVRIVSAGGALSLLLCLGYLLNINPLKFSVFPFFALIYGLVTTVIPLLIWQKTGKNFKKNPIFLENLTFEIDTDAIHIHSASMEKHLPLAGLTEVKKIGNDWLIYTSPVAFFGLPMHQLPADIARQTEQILMQLTTKK